MEGSTTPYRAAPGNPPNRGIRPADAGGGAGSRAESNGTLRILIVEDETFVALHAQELLEEAGHEVIGTAIAADEAIEKAEKLSPDLIVMDIRLLGRRDGIDAAIEIYERFGIRCLFASGHADEETQARAQKAQPVGFLSKPFTKRTLLNAVESYGTLQ